MTLTEYSAAAEAIKAAFPRIPRTALTLGSGLAGFTEGLKIIAELPYGKIPNFPAATNPNHRGGIYLAEADGTELLIFRGRVHFYEGYSMEQTAFYVRVLRFLNVKNLIITNAAGAVNENYAPGDIVLLRDHIKFCAESPARGEHIPEFGQRFFDMGNAYNRDFQNIAKKSAERLHIKLQSGVYMYFAGPGYETPAEIRAARALGADAVGMSTVPEVIAAAQCEIRVLGLSLITNMAAGITGEILSDCDVVNNAAASGDKLGMLLTEIIKNTGGLN